MMNKTRYFIYLLDHGDVVGAMTYKSESRDIEMVTDRVCALISEPLYARYKPPYDTVVVRSGEQVTRRRR